MGGVVGGSETLRGLRVFLRALWVSSRALWVASVDGAGLANTVSSDVRRRGWIDWAVSALPGADCSSSGAGPDLDTEGWDCLEE